MAFVEDPSTWVNIAGPSQTAASTGAQVAGSTATAASPLAALGPVAGVASAAMAAFELSKLFSGLLSNKTTDPSRMFDNMPTNVQGAITDGNDLYQRMELLRKREAPGMATPAQLKTMQEAVATTAANLRNKYPTFEGMTDSQMVQELIHGRIPSQPQTQTESQPQSTNGGISNSFNNGDNPVTPQTLTPSTIPPINQGLDLSQMTQQQIQAIAQQAQPGAGSPTLTTGASMTNTPLGAQPGATPGAQSAPQPASTQPLSNLPSQQQFLQQLFQMFGLGNGGAASALQGAGTAAGGGGALGGLVGAGLGQVGGALDGLFGGQSSSQGGSSSNTNTNNNVVSPTATSTNTNTISPSFTGGSNTNTINPSFTGGSNTNTINVAPATVPNQTNSNNLANTYQFNNGGGFQTPANGMLGGSFGQDPNNPDPNAFSFGNQTPPPATNQQAGATPSNPLTELLKMFGIENPAQAGLGAGILGVGQLLNKDVNLPDFWSDRGVQDLYNFGNSAQHPMDPNVEAAMQRTLDIQNEQQMRNLRDVYKNARPGGDYLNDSAYQRDLANLQRNTQVNNADAMAGAQFKSNDQQIGVKSNLAEGSVGQGRLQGLMDAQKNANTQKLFGDLGSAAITGSFQKPTNIQNIGLLPK